MIITPTVGRKVWYRPFGHASKLLQVWDDKQPCDATIIYVWHDRMVNLIVTGPNGVTQPFNSVQLLQNGDPTPTIEHGGYAEWMPYQAGQAAKAEEAATVTDEMVSRFLAWPVPAGFFPDGYVSFDREKAAASGSWPTGTNLLDAFQARAMLEFVLNGALKS